MSTNTSTGSPAPSILDNYNPSTIFSKFFNSERTINIDILGCNKDDFMIEQHIINKTGSYGKQLGAVIPMINALIEHTGYDSGTLPTDQMKDLTRFENLAKEQKNAKEEFRKELSHTDMDRIIQFIEENKKKQSADYIKIKQVIF